MTHLKHPPGASKQPTMNRARDPLLDAFRFACPTTHAPLEYLEADSMHSRLNGNVYRRVDGIWRFLRLHRAAYFAEFVAGYEALRRAEGRGSAAADFYRALPYAKVAGNNPFHSTAGWQLRARSYETLMRDVVQPLARRRRRPLRIADLGAGNGWLSHRLAQAGHHVLAVDVLTNREDGLGAFVQYEVPFVPLQAEFEMLPLSDGQLDLVIFNAAFHYADDYETVLLEAARLLLHEGRLVIMDSPFYNAPESGLQMVAERAAYFAAQVGSPQPATEAEGFLTYDHLTGLALRSGLAWHLHWPLPQWRWTWRRWRARRHGDREPAQFPLVCGSPI